MGKIPKHLYTLLPNLCFALLLALFYMIFGIFYRPSFGYDTVEWDNNVNLCIPIISAIVLVIACLSRSLMIVTTRSTRLSEMGYLLWQIAELFVIVLFVDMFASLYFYKNYFDLLPTILLIAAAIGLFPYTIFWLYIERVERDIRIAEAQQTIITLRSKSLNTEENVIRFVDEKGNAKLMVPLSKIYVIEAAGNYVNIAYDDNGTLKRFALRNTLKGIETICTDTDLQRCHRSYYVNIRKIKLIKKDAAGTYAELLHNSLPDVPISKNYAAQIAESFSAIPISLKETAQE